ncbi:DUF6985 domain-containing protein [Lederbergia lenta]|uniref:DUF6985 domain-containing protein n=1 Tax=Lederbergia lenta TaxID=1467 RepID=A0A2X4VMB2_LEDLE|nr:hypothetical protein [Lederbergia lenta]MEC2326062.1 hypothetical protein [Lederbergia lenta]SQI53297.1 Uncharacterised protein [Lederbergia lenta]
MIENIQETKYGIEGTTYSKLFDKHIRVWLEDGVDLEYGRFCVDALNHLNDKLIDEICRAAIAYCEDFCDAIGQEPPKIEKARDILNYIDPTGLIVDEPRDPHKPVIHLEGNCEWEVEHGIEFIIREDQLLYLSSFNGMGAWDEPESYKDSYNYAYKAI